MCFQRDPIHRAERALGNHKRTKILASAQLNPEKQCIELQGRRNKAAALMASDVPRAPKTCICLKAVEGYELIHLKEVGCLLNKNIPNKPLLSKEGIKAT